ncbi:Cell division cycle protein 123 [Rhodotorula toruloides]|nr:Cell division cycle protein 123 [Rhodotorula toruloides]
MAVPLAPRPPPAPSSPDPPLFPPLHTADILACQFSHWYPLFKRISPKATVIRPIPQEDDFVEYLESDGLFLPEGSGPMGLSELSDSDSDDEPTSSSSSTASSTDGADDRPTRSPRQRRQFSFPHLDAEIRSALARYDGAVFPKLNWSSPQDAAWMLPGQNLKCQTPADVYLLLKSSDFISHDLDRAFDDCIDYDPTLSLEGLSLDERRGRRGWSFELVLKKWFDMPRSQEWRCFVRENRLLAISQRDTTFYDFLQGEQVKANLTTQISDFWAREIRDKAPLSSYIFDIYLTRDSSRLFLIDLNPFSPRTDTLLFPPSHLLSLHLSPPSSPDLRVVESEKGGGMPRYAHNRYPRDVVELSEGQSVAEFAREWVGRVAEASVPTDEEKGKREQREEERIGR